MTITERWKRVRWALSDAPIVERVIISTQETRVLDADVHTLRMLADLKGHDGQRSQEVFALPGRFTLFLSYVV